MSVQPRRRFGIWLATALVVGNIVGSGIFLLPASLAPHGWNMVSAWLITGTGALALAWVFAQLSKHLAATNDAGSYAFMRAGLGETPAFLGAWGYVVSIWASNAAITIAGVSYLTRVIPPLGDSAIASPITALAAIWLLAAVNMRGRRAAGGVQLGSSIIKLLPFVVVIGLALWHLLSDGAAALPPVQAGSFTLASTSAAVGLTLYAMLGLESAAVPSDAVERPERTVPIATMVGTGLSTVVTILATCSVALMLPAAEVSVSRAPVSDFIARTFGGGAGWLVAVCAVVSCFGCLNGWLFLSAELPASLADRGALPRWFGARNAGGTATTPLLLGASVTSLLTLLAYTKVGVAAYNFVALMATSTSLLMYLLCILTAWRLMAMGRIPRSRGLVVAIALALVFAIWAFYGSGWEALGWGAALVALGWPLYRAASRAVVTATADPDRTAPIRSAGL